jgi:SAM-dependent methyltransferase
MKILIAVANYGTNNDRYLSRVLSEYQKMPYQTDIVVLSNVPKELGSAIEVVVGLPSRNPYSLPFAHKRIFAERRADYDLFIYTEDDILITQRNIEAFLRVTNLLPSSEIAGLVRYEQYPDGARFYPDSHAFYRWIPDSVKRIGEYEFARFTNDHSGCYVLTRDQLAQALASGGFVVPPHEHQYRLRETAASDPFTQCGLTKVICLSHLEDFLVPHLPNRYIGSRLGLDEPEFHKQLNALLRPSRRSPATASLLQPETKVFHAEWSKDYYEPCRHDLIALFPPETRSVLSIGCGWGETEAELMKTGIEVTAIPVDSIIAACAESRGVKVIHGDLESATKQLRGRCFDGVLMSGVLHLVLNPREALRQAGSLLKKPGVLVATVPNFRRVPFLWLWLSHPSRYSDWRDFQHSGVHPITRRQLRTWLRDNGFSLERVASTIPQRWRILVALSGGVAEPFFASEYILLGRRNARDGSVTPHSDPQRDETEHDLSLVSGRHLGR